MCFSHGAAMWFDRLSRLTSMLVVDRFRVAVAALAIATHVVTAAEAAAASLLRDPDIEHGLSELAAPVLRAAGLNPKRVRVLVVDDSSLNAFVVDGQTVFLHHGLILKVQSAAMLQAVIAHEAAHISNGHIARRMGNLRSARTAAGLGAALAVAAAAAGAGSAAGGIAAGTASSALRGFFVHTRAEESAADRSAAHYMTSTGLDPQGLVDLHRAFAGQEALSVGRQDPYMQSHPLTQDRIRVAESYVAAQPVAPPSKPEDTYWFARVQGKLSAFTRAPKWTLRRAPEEPHADVRLMREAIAHHRNNDLKAALKAMDAAIAARPDDAYYHELKGQILLENRQLQPALDAYRTAVALAPRESLIQGSYGRALLAADQPKAALGPLEEARSRDFRDARVMRDLALAYARLGETGMAALTTAERHALEGRMEDAARQAQRATTLLPRGSAPWQRAQDVVIASEHANKRKKR
ncbi:M48 family metalloprotease [Sedimentitalea sp. JM2-8]|uniref:M48 family metalloprotease n=1 Tax=Sedimentitalea xiamensis TaxID=3050037 RepID=A0ABT7FCX0_9RHOB|nr:M48 family metalloprotease [Sedimentitalea xiamensis]MDK3072971.1 M48 family metalloprotease [Sedimentitalea xiamensis]